MNRRVTVTRNVNQQVKDLLGQLLQQSLVDIRGDIPFTMRDVVRRFDMDVTNIIDLDATPIRRDLFRDETVNTLMDSAYVDHYVQYIDAFTLQDALTNLRGLFDSGIMAAVMRAGELKSRIHDYTLLAENQHDFTDVFHNTFNDSYNGAAIDTQLSISPTAGIIRLQSIDQNFCEPEHCNIKLSLISLDPDIIDESDAANAYNNNMMSPYFVTCVAYGDPTNPDYGTINFGEESGILVRLEIKFAGVFPITRVSFAQFSTMPFDIIAMYYSQKATPEWHIDDLDEIDITGYSSDNNEVEINFDRVYAQTVWIVLRQKHYLEAKSQTALDQLLTTSEYLDYVGGVVERIAIDGFTETEDEQDIAKEIVASIKAQVDRLSDRVEPHARAYTLGVFNVKAANASYMQYGEYESQVEKLRGNVASVAVAFDGSVDMTASGQVDTAAVFSLVLPGDKEVFLGQTFLDAGVNQVIDTAIISENTILSGGNLIPDPEHPYKFKTHFVPAPDADTVSIRLFVDGYEEVIEPGVDEVSWDGNRLEVRLPAVTCEAYNLYDGKVVTMRYEVPAIDRYGRSYDIDEVDILKALGKPNIRDNAACELGDRYMYHKSGEVYVSYAPGEWFECNIEGEDSLFYCIYTGKGEAATDDVLQIGTKLFLPEKLVIPPYDDFYYGVTGDPAADQNASTTHDDVTYQTYKTDLPYVKGTLKVYVDGVYTNEVIEYETDIDGNIATNDMKRVFYVHRPESESVVTCSYIPLDVDDPGSGYVNTNIAQHTEMERFTGTTDKKLRLSRFAFHDNTIVTSPTFAVQNGVFFLKRKYSIVYEPIVVYINGIKATNIHDYETGLTPEFKPKKRTTDYQYYFEHGDTLVFNEELKGNIIVYYYTLSDSFKTRISLYRSNSFREDQTPELYNYTILANIQRH